MEYHLLTGVLTAILLSCVIRETSGATYYSLDPCPDGVSPGESWTPHSNSCGRCDCHEHEQGYSCSSCGVILLVPHDDCYVDHDTPDALYPDCCILKEFCPGDSRYNASMVSGLIG